MARVDAISMLYYKNKSPLEFVWDSLLGPSLLQYFTYYDIDELRKIATSVKMAGNITKKYSMIDEIMQRRGFKKFHAGTNRVVYTCYENPHIVAKVAIDQVGMQDNPSEYKNQLELKPFVTKCFDVSPCGVIGLFERVEPITSKEEFAYVADDVFELLTKCILGSYVLEDIGANFYNNFGIRKGFGVCLLDYPYMYKLDGNKLLCNKPIIPNTTHPVCGGEIDYDNGFNYLICKKCGKKYSAKDLQKKISSGELNIIRKGSLSMKITLKRGDKVVNKYDISASTSIKKEPKKIRNRNKQLKVTVVGSSSVESKEEIVSNEISLDTNIIENDDIKTEAFIEEQEIDIEDNDYDIEEDDSVEVEETTEEDYPLEDEDEEDSDSSEEEIKDEDKYNTDYSSEDNDKYEDDDDPYINYTRFRSSKNHRHRDNEDEYRNTKNTKSYKNKKRNLSNLKDY